MMEALLAKQKRREGSVEMQKTLPLLLLLIAAGCAATPDEVRQKCLAHEVPHPSTAAEIGMDLGGRFSFGIANNVNASRAIADCSMILGDEELKKSCPAYVVACEQYFAERQNAAGASRVTVNQVNP
jgi:hypothetical protein